MDAKSVAEFRLTEDDLKEALETLPKDQKDALTQAAQRIREFHEHELDRAGPLRKKTEQSSASATFRSIPSVSMFLAVKPRTRLPF